MTGEPGSLRSNSKCLDAAADRLGSASAGARLSAALLVGLSAAPAWADPPAPTEVTVRAAPRRRDPARVTISTEEGRRVPGTQGDALKVVESLPGVGRSAFGGGKLVVWGAAPSDTRVYVDGVEVPALYHESGLRGTVNADLVQSIDLFPGAYGPEFGRGLGGLIRVQTRNLPSEGIHGYVGADLLDASGMLSAAVGGRLRIAVAGRGSYLDRILAGVVSPDVGDYFPIPRYRDYQAKAQLTLREDEELSLLLLGSGDTIERAKDSPDPATVLRETTESGYHRVILRYTRTSPDGDSVSVTPFFGQDRRDFTASFGPLPERQGDTAWKYGARASYRARITEAITASVGVDALGSASELSRVGSLDTPPRDGDHHVFGQPPGADVNADDWTANIVDVGPYALAEVRLGPVTITPGLRADAFLIEGSRLTPRVGQTPALGFSRLSAAIDPRLSVSWAVTPRITLSAAFGLYHQPPAPADLSAVFGTPALGVARGLHVSGGQAVRLAEGLGVELTGYYESLDHLVVRSRLASPKLARALTQDGEGRSYGVQVLLKKQLKDGLLGWVAYSASRSERRRVGDPSYRLSDHDQTSVLSAVVSYSRQGWGAGARFRYATGAPRTPVVGSFYEATNGHFEPIFGAENAIRLPDFYALDLRLEKKIPFSRVSLDVYLDVLNVTYRKNAEEVIYSFDFSQRSYITGLPTLAVLGARLSF